MLKKVPFTIRARIVLLFTLLLAIITLFINIYFPVSFEKKELQSLKERADLYNSTIAYDVEPSLYFGYNPFTRQIIERVKKYKEIAYVVIEDPKGAVNKQHNLNYNVAENANYKDISSGIDISNNLYKTKTVILHYNDVLGKSEKIGELYVGYTYDYIKNEINNSRLLIGIISVLLFLFTWIAAYSLSSVITKSLDSIIITAKQIAKGKIRNRVSVSNDEIGNVAKAINVMLDNIEFSQQNMEELNKKLEILVDLRTSELKQEVEQHKKTAVELLAAKEKAEEMSKLKSNFLANMSHELRTPMNGILGFSEIIQLSTQETEIVSMAKKINESGNRLLNTLNSILDLSIIESNNFVVQLSEVDLISETEKHLNLLSPLADNKNIYLRFTPKKKSIFLNIDKHIYYQIINNIVGNAIKFTFEKGVEVEIDTMTENNHLFAVIKVIDTGIGIPDKYHKIIFEEFRQVSEGVSRSFEGNGLGLTITKRMINLLNGDITLQSTFGAGSTFTVKLPAISFEELGGEVETPVPETQFVKSKMLIVDDDDITRKVIKIFLKDLFEIDEVSSGEAAIDIVTSKNFDMILMDISLKGMSGIDTTKKIRKTPGYENVPIIALTAYAMVGDREKFINGGCSHYLSKPFDKEGLTKVVKNALKTKS